MADDRHSGATCLPLEVGKHTLNRSAGRQRLDSDDWRPFVERGRDHLGRLAGADEWTRQHGIELHTETNESACGLSHAVRSIFGQRPLGVVWPRVATLFRDAVTYQIELVRSRHSTNLSFGAAFGRRSSDESVTERKKRGSLAHVTSVKSPAAVFERDHQAVQVAPGFQIRRGQAALNMANAIDEGLCVGEPAEQHLDTSQRADVTRCDVACDFGRELSPISELPD